MKRMPHYWLSVVCVVVGASSYGLLSPFIKKTYDAGYTFEQLTVHQSGIGLLLLGIVALIRFRQWRNPFRGQWIKQSLVGVFGLSLTTVLYNLALMRLEASFAIVLLFQFTWITILLDSVRQRAWPDRNKLIGVAFVMGGTLLAVGLMDATFSRVDGAGIVYGFLSAVTYSLFIWLTGRLDRGSDPIVQSVVMMCAGFLFIVLLYGSKAGAGAAEGPLIGWGLLLGALGLVVPTVAFNIGIPRIGSSLAALLGAVELPVAALASWLMLGEQLNAAKIAGIALIFIGIGIAERPGGNRPGSLTRLEEKR
ncbi:EamA family transporter [Paenibacillus humicola]|uniref:EamA family transporter n=1 Tax=Paenibacillus humicola TaxID=3110540 RepID=UPI00237C51D1|nr:DMT family transporter [Paenibacillus humicola]